MKKGSKAAAAAAAAASSAGSVQVDQQSAMQLTLTVLQRQDPAVEEILFTAGHVTVYEFDVAAHAWVRSVGS